jgi:hypothetical protein
MKSGFDARTIVPPVVWPLGLTVEEVTRFSVS